MRRFPLSLLMAASVLLAPKIVEAAEEKKKILILRSGSMSFYTHAVEGFLERMSSSRIPFVVDDRVLPKKDEEIDAFMEAARGEKPDLIFAVGTLATRTAQEKSGDIPFTYCLIVDPPSLGLHGGGSVMEVHPAKQIEFIREHFPNLVRIGVIHSSSRNQESVQLFKELAARDASLLMVQADNPEQMSNAILSLSKRADCLLMVSDATLYSPQTATQIILQTLQANLPLIAISPSFVRAGALVGIYPDAKENGVLAAEAALRHFGGEALKKMPIFWPGKTLHSVNLIVAERLKVLLPEKSIKSASEVVR